MRISDWSSDVCSSDLSSMMRATARPLSFALLLGVTLLLAACAPAKVLYVDQAWVRLSPNDATPSAGYFTVHGGERSEEHTSELQSLMRISYAVFCLKKTNPIHNIYHQDTYIITI